MKEISLPPCKRLARPSARVEVNWQSRLQRGCKNSVLISYTNFKYIDIQIKCIFFLQYAKFMNFGTGLKNPNKHYNRPYQLIHFEVQA